VAHTHNPSYLGGRDQEDHSSRPAPGEKSKTLSQKYPTQRWAKIIIIIVTIIMWALVNATCVLLGVMNQVVFEVIFLFAF
jgi:hypothetical protein